MSNVGITIYNPVTGDVLRYVEVDISDVAIQAKEGEAVFNGYADARIHRIVEGFPPKRVDKPAKPVNPNVVIDNLERAATFEHPLLSKRISEVDGWIDANVQDMDKVREILGVLTKVIMSR